MPSRVALTVTPALSQKLSALKLTSISGAATEVKALKLTRAHIAPSIQAQFKRSEKKALNLSRGLFRTF